MTITKEVTVSEQNIYTLSSTLKNPEWILQRRIEAWKEYKNNNSSITKYGLGIFTDTSSFSDSLLHNVKIPEFSKIFSIENGEDIEVLPLPQAMIKYKELFQKKFLSTLKNKDRFSSLHEALWCSGLFIKIKENREYKKPVIIKLHQYNKVHLENLFIEVGKKAKVNFVVLSESSDKVQFSSHVVELFLEEGATVSYAALQQMNPSVFHVSYKNCVLDKDAKIEWLTCDIGSAFIKTETCSYLEGQGAAAYTKSIVFGDEQQKIDSLTSSLHRAPDTFSDILVKSVLAGASKGIFRGLVRIGEHAFRSNGYQKEETLILSDEAEANAIPDLLINNNDVRCTHGATIAKIDGEKLFYLKSRGISEEEATTLIIEGFFNPLIHKIDDKKIQEDIKKFIQQKIRALKK